MGGEQPISYDYFLDKYGLGPEEVNSPIQFGGYEGTVAEMLEDGRCPVGNALAEGYRSGGIEGVATKIAGLQMVFGEFTIPISDKTRSFHEGTTDRESLLAENPGESPDFLASPA